MVFWAAIAAALSAPGCEGISGIATFLMGSPKVEAVYVLSNRSTLVLVDDPEIRLGDPALAGVVASNVAYALVEHEVLQSQIVSQEDLVQVANRLGQDFLTTPIDEIGRMLGAEQVIYVSIEQTQLQVEPGLYRPAAIVDVKVIDATVGKRIFPEPVPRTSSFSVAPGHRLVVRPTHRRIGVVERGVKAALANKLAVQIGLDVARMFFDWKKPEPGSRLGKVLKPGS